MPQLSTAAYRTCRFFRSAPMGVSILTWNRIFHRPRGSYHGMGNQSVRLGAGVLCRQQHQVCFERRERGEFARGHAGQCGLELFAKRGVCGRGHSGGQTGFIGFAFDPDNIAGAQTFFGWARMSVGDNATTSGVVVDWAYDDTGAGIAAGTAPEPTSLGLLALGAAGLLAFRRRTAQVS